MRSPARLLEAICTLNFQVVGWPVICLRIGANLFRTHGEFGDAIRDEIRQVAAFHESPHVRELAEELLALEKGARR